MPRYRYRLACAATGLVLAALAGCTVPSTTTQPGGGAAGSSAGAAASANPSVDAKSAADAGIDPANPPKALATTAITSDLGTLHVSVVRAKRTDKLLNVVFALTPETTKTDTQSLFKWVRFWYPYLVDGKNLKRYSAVSGGTGYLQSDESGTDLVPGKTTYAYAVFAAPPADVTAVDVTFAAGGAPMLGVPIS